MFKPRGYKVALKTGSLPEVVSPHVLKLIVRTGGIDGPIGRQFVACPELENDFESSDCDPLLEEKYEVLPGVIYKYRGVVGRNGKIERHGRVLWTVTNFCASYCRFCTRGRLSGLNKKFEFVNDRNLDKVFSFLKKHREINEVILSGGDPLTLPKDRFEKIIFGLADLRKRGFIDIVRIGTRLPIVAPLSVRDWHYKLLAKLKNPYLMVHINHPAELTFAALKVLENFRKKSYALEYSQSVLLKGVNDSADVLCELFNKLVANGIRPYYILQNDPVPWARHFTVPFAKALKIWGEVKPRLSGIASTCRFVVDGASDEGKVPIPDDLGWEGRLPGKRFSPG